MAAIQDALGKLREVWDNIRWLDFAHLLDYAHWFGYGVGIDEQGAHIVLFCRTGSLPLALRLFIEDLGSQRYRLRVNGQAIDVRIIVTGRFVSLGGGPPGGPPPPQIRAGDRVMASWQEGTVHPVQKKSQVGTIGAILRKAGDPKPWLLSANHVIGINCRATNRNFQVNRTDGGTPGETIGTVVKCIRMTSSDLCPADAAAVQIDLPTGRIATAHPSGLASRTPFPISSQMAPGTVSFKKTGATTGSTESQLVAVEATLDVDVEFRGNVQMSNQIVTSPFADHGDSGALAVEKTSGQPVGLVVAFTDPDQPGEQQLTVLSPIESVLAALPPGFSLVLPGDVL